MKKIAILATAAIGMLASCTTNDFVGDENLREANERGNGAIVFGTGVKAPTRAEYTGADAAGKLKNKFIVGGFKGTGTSTIITAGSTTAGVPATTTVFDNYQVNWTTNTAGTTQSNTSDWEYVGLIAEAPSTLKGNTQSIKYWDYAVNQYDFIAYSTGDAAVITSGDPTTGKVLVSPINASNAGKSTIGAYTLKGASEDLAKCYIADMVTVYKEGASLSPAQPKFRDEVRLKFCALTSKVRVALYETIPGYSVKDVKFYTNATTNLGSATETNATLFTTGTTDKDNFYTAGEYKVYFPTIGKDNISLSDYNKAHVTFTPNESGGKGTTKSFAALNYGGIEYKEKTGTQFLGRNSVQPTFAGTDPYYQIAMPNEEGAVLELRIDYTLESIDGSGEEIKIYGATAFVPAIYAAWKPNYAYTYLFKISDNTNGWTNKVDAATNSTDPAGLYPITFDAVVMEDGENTQSTITTVATPSITTYQKGHVYTDDEYDASKGDIYVQVMGDVLKNDLNSNGKLYIVTGGPSGKTVTEADVMDALNTYESSTGTPQVITGRNSWILTDATTTASVDATITAIPSADGNNITVTAGTAAKFTPTASTTYAYVYDATPSPAPAESSYYTAVTFTGSETKPTDWQTNYFKDSEGNSPVTDSDFAPGTFYKKYTNKNKVYGVKVIRVKAGS